MSTDFIFKVKRNNGTFSVFALQFNDSMQVKLTVIKGENPLYNEVLTVLFTHTDVIERIRNNQMSRINPSRVVTHVGMSSAKDLWIEYVWNKDNNTESDFNFIPSVKQTQKFHISMYDKVETFELYIMDLIDIAIELRIISITPENGIKYGDRWIPYLNITEVKPMYLDGFVKAEVKNNIYRMLENFNFDDTESETNNSNHEVLMRCKSKVENGEVLSQNEIEELKATNSIMGENLVKSNTYNFISQCMLKVSQIIPLNETEIKQLNDIDSDTANDILHWNEVNEKIIERINETLRCVENNTILDTEEIEFLNGIVDTIPQLFSELVKSILDKHYTIEREHSQIISNIIEQETREDNIVYDIINEYERKSETSSETEIGDKYLTNLLKLDVTTESDTQE